MLVYAVGSVLTSFFLFISQYYYRKIKKNNLTDKNYSYYLIFFIASILPLSLISGVRYGVGTDYFFTYYPRFYLIFSGAKGYNEIPFTLLNRFIQLFTLDATWLFIITSFIYVLFMLLSIKKMSNHWWLSSFTLLLGGYYFISMNNVRQSCAIAISIYAFTYAMDKKFIRTLIFTSLAMCFHLTAIVLLPMYLIINLKFIKNVFPYVSIVILMLTPAVLDVVILIIENTRYAGYLKYNIDQPIYSYIISFGAIFIISLIFFKKLVNTNRYAYGLIFIAQICFMISICSFTIQSVETMSRACAYFTWPIIFILPIFLDCYMHKKFAFVVVFILVVFLSLNTYYLIIYLGHHEVLPYVSIFNI